MTTKSESNSGAGETKALKAAAAAKAAQDHYARMVRDGYKKYGIFLKIETMKGIDLIASSSNTPKYQLIDKILENYVNDYVSGG
jgi:hypothetical protein